jgi:hypothetical protein
MRKLSIRKKIYEERYIWIPCAAWELNHTAPQYKALHLDPMLCTAPQYKA